MTSLHSSDLTRRLGDYLARRQPPKGFAGDDRRKAEQIAAYVGILRRYAPQGDRLDDWWASMLATLAETSETWAWPTEGDLVKACKIIAKDIKRGESSEFKIDPLDVAEKRIEADEPIGDNWLWGRNALALISRVGVEPILVRRDRFAGDLARVYGPAEARRMILVLEDRHREAVKITEETRVGRRHDIPEVQIKSVRDLLGPGPEYVPYRGAAE